MVFYYKKVFQNVKHSEMLVKGWFNE